MKRKLLACPAALAVLAALALPSAAMADSLDAAQKGVLGESVTINSLCGAITTSSASLAAEAAAEFTVTNSLVGIADVPVAGRTRWTRNRYRQGNYGSSASTRMVPG